MRNRISWRCVVVLAALIACGGGDTLDPDAFIVQIVNPVAYQPKFISCRGGGAPEVYFNVRMVNTTRDTVRIESVHTVAFVKAAASDSLVGKLILQVPSLAFQEPPQPLRSGDGDVTFTSILKAVCSTLGGATGIDVYLYVKTSAGEFAALPASLGIGY